VLEATQLHKRFGSLVAVEDMSLHLAKGEVLAFLGPNCSGKTTTAKMLAGLLYTTSSDPHSAHRRFQRFLGWPGLDQEGYALFFLSLLQPPGLLLGWIVAQNLHLYTPGRVMHGDPWKGAVGFPSDDGYHDPNGPIPTLDHPGPFANPPPPSFPPSPAPAFPPRPRQGQTPAQPDPVPLRPLPLPEPVPPGPPGPSSAWREKRPRKP